MSVNIYLDKKPIDVGWNSSFDYLLNDFQRIHRPSGESYMELYAQDISKLKEIRKNQWKGVKEPPFDWWPEAAKAIDKIIKTIKSKGVAEIVFCY